MTKKRYTDEQVILEAEYLIEGSGHSTYEVADKFHIPQSTVWWHMKVRIPRIDYMLQTLVNYELEKRWKGGGH